MWFEALTGVDESDRSRVYSSLTAEDGCLRSLINGKSFRYGLLETPSLGDLRSRAALICPSSAPLRVREIVSDAQALHRDPQSAGALFQVASQFNLLEMVSPQVTPERGVGIYEGDPTQGPACAIAAGAGTIYRNYFVRLAGQLGQTASRQIDCLQELGAALGNTDGSLWTMRNGYALPSHEGLNRVHERLSSTDEPSLDALRARLRVGVQWNTQVTLDGAQHLVTQAYCSALPVAYTPHDSALWRPLAKLVLEAAYEATLCVGLLNAQLTGDRRVYLTQLGGGVFGNAPAWIIDAICRALDRYATSGLDVSIVSFRRSDPRVEALCRRYA